MDLKWLRRRCEERLRIIDIPDPFTVEAFRQALADRRGRAVDLHPLPESSNANAPCGVWVATATADHVFYEPGTSPFHRDHIICHELAHLLCGHALDVDENTLSVLPDLDPALVRHMLGRVSYTNEQEQEAEMLAGLILQKAARDSAQGAPRDANPVLSRLDSVFGRLG